MPLQDPAQQDCLTVEHDGPVTRIVFDNPKRRNAINLASWQRLVELVPALARQPETRVIVLSGRGDDFSAGADISEFDTVRRDEATARVYEAANSAAFAAIRNAGVPVIAAIRGICFGGGFGLAAAADLRIATPDAEFSVPAARLGLAYPQDAMIDIVSSAGPQMARYLTYSAAHIDAAAALVCGFLLQIVQTDRFDARVDEIAHQIAANAPLSIKASKLSIAAALSGDTATISAAMAAGDRTFASEDYAEGRTAFRDKRQPRFRGI
ncbi:MAG: enoyl-CoA hydratase-related protein [Rhizobiaceae bacterium]